jgi:hypothetical protein
MVLKVGSWFFVVRALGVVVAEVTMHWALALVGLFGYWLWDMLSVMVVEGM